MNEGKESEKYVFDANDDKQFRDESVQNIKFNKIMDDRNMECIKRLEQRIDNLEDYSRRDNLLFYGFTEQFNEDCTELVKDLICKKILANNVNAAEIKFVRAHRLGKFNGSGAKPRPIIVKFREFSDKMKVFMSKKHLKNSPYVVTEDFSANTNSQREFLQDCINEAKTNLGDTMDAGFLRYKTLIIKSNDGSINRFSATYIDAHPYDWWKKVLGTENGNSHFHNLNRREQSSSGNARVGGSIPPSPEDNVADTPIPTENVISEPIPLEDSNGSPEPILSEDGNGSVLIDSVDVQDSTSENSKGEEGEDSHR